MEGYIARIATSFIEIPGKICTSIYFTGCNFKCIGCQNPELQLLSNGTLTSLEQILREIDENKLAKWVCFLGGEPFEQPEFLFNLCSNISKPIGIYTGNTFDILTKKYSKIIELPNIKFLKTGKFMINLMNDIEFPITSNQMVFLKSNNKWISSECRNISGVSREISVIL